MLLRGVLLALAAAVVNTFIDGLRKSAAVHLPPTALVTLTACLDAVLSCTGVAVAGGFKGAVFQAKDRHTFTAAVLSSSCLLLLSKALNQQALAMSPLSLTVPYLSFTPSFLVVTAYILLGEEPSPMGMMGVGVVTLGGYLLSRSQVSGAESSGLASKCSSGTVTPSSSSTALSSIVIDRGGGLASSGGAAAGSEGGAVGSEAGSAGNHHHLHHSHSLNHSQCLHPNSQLSLRDPTPRPQQLDGMGSGGAMQGSQGAHSRHVGAPGQEALHAGGFFATPTAVAEKMGLVRASMEGASKKGSKGLLAGFTGGIAGAAGGPGGPLWSCIRASGMDPGSAMMLCVAAMWSVTASLDKLGVLHAPNVWVYFALQRLAIGLMSLAYLVVQAPHMFALLRSRHAWLFLVLSLSELSAVVLFLEAINYLFVSYVVAIKRSNILFSVLLGGCVFKESILRRLPFVALMLAGMTLIVVEPDAGTTHNTVHA